MAEPSDPDLPEAAQRALASRRRELEREFDLKRADLKIQHQRRMEQLKREQAEWDAHRRQQAKALADKTETVRRRVDNQQQRVDLAAAERKELADLRAQVKELERKEREAGRIRDRLQEELGGAAKRIRAARRNSYAAMLLVAILAAVVALLLR